MEKIKIVFYSNGEKVVDIVNNYKDVMERMVGTNYSVTLWNSELVEVYYQDKEDRRKWNLNERFTNEFVKVK